MWSLECGWRMDERRERKGRERGKVKKDRKKSEGKDREGEEKEEKTEKMQKREKDKQESQERWQKQMGPPWNVVQAPSFFFVLLWKELNTLQSSPAEWIASSFLLFSCNPDSSFLSSHPLCNVSTQHEPLDARQN